MLLIFEEKERTWDIEVKYQKGVPKDSIKIKKKLGIMAVFYWLMEGCQGNILLMHSSGTEQIVKRNKQFSDINDI